MALGPQGTNGHEVASRVAKAMLLNRKTKVEFCDRNEDVLETVARKKCFGVVPIENSIFGLVAEVKDFWLREQKLNKNRGVFVIGECHLPIEHHLMSLPTTKKIKDIRKVVSHPQALGQCKVNLDRLNLCVRDASTSTARAAELVSNKKSGRNQAAIASRLAAQIYGLNIMKENMEDVKGNVTRFHVIGRKPCEPTGQDRTALIFRVPNSPKALANALCVFGSYDINLSTIHSLPLGLPGQFAFYCEFDIHMRTSKGKKLWRSLISVTESTYLLGSYPQSPLPQTGGVS